MAISRSVALGLDFGTESVRALLVDLRGRELGSASVSYEHGQLTATLPGSRQRLPHDFAFQHPQDWIDASIKAVRKAVKQTGIAGQAVACIGVDFTSCTMLPAMRDGTPLCLLDRHAGNMFAWPKLWKHHGAKSQTARINALAAQRQEPWFDRYGRIIGLEFLFPKMLETLEEAPGIYEAAEVWLEGGDWYVWQLLGPGVCPAERLPRSTCQAGYKGMWSAADGFPSRDFFGALHPKMADVVASKMPGRMVAPGQLAGGLGTEMAKKMGLKPGIAVSAAVIDAHAGVPGAGVWEADTLVMVMGTSSCHMLNSKVERVIPGVAGVVRDGILPGYFGYETGQAAVGDAFAWFRQMVGAKDFSQLDRQAALLAPGSDGVLCMDWMAGCRTPLMDGNLRGAFTGLTLGSTTAHLYRALLEASAMGVRWIVDVLRDGDVPVRKFVATGGLPHHNPLLVQIYADVLGTKILVPAARQGPALGAAILGVLAAGKDVTGFANAKAAIQAMAGAGKAKGVEVKPDRAAVKVYDEVYGRYRALAQAMAV